jgi:amino acid transporter
VQTRRLVPIGLVLALLLAAAGVASHGRPLSASRGTGPSATFFDYVLTTIVLVVVAIVAVAALSLLGSKPAKPAPQPRRWHLLSSFLIVIAGSLIGWALVHSHLRFQPPTTHTPPQHVQTTGGRRGKAAARHTRGAQLRWDEIAIVGIVLGGVLVYAFAVRRRGLPRPPWSLRPQEAVSAALDESLDDLRLEPDFRKAIIAAYARMERALAAAGIRRRPAEAPFEYLVRALQALDASAAASRRLTDLFEWAKFSQHDPEPAMRDEAIDALVEVRDELRRPAAVPA